jgi:hypothetical protein
MSLPTETWICDQCRGLIEQADHGWVEWICTIEADGKTITGSRMRIVHASGHGANPRLGCQYERFPENRTANRSVADAALIEFQGPDGLMRLLEKIADGSVEKNSVLEIIKRIHIPGYEHARLHFDRALAEGVIEPDVEPGYWLSEDRERVMDMVNGDES